MSNNNSLFIITIISTSLFIFQFKQAQVGPRGCDDDDGNSSRQEPHRSHDHRSSTQRCAEIIRDLLLQHRHHLGQLSCIVRVEPTDATPLQYARTGSELYEKQIPNHRSAQTISAAAEPREKSEFGASHAHRMELPNGSKR